MTFTRLVLEASSRHSGVQAVLRSRHGRSAGLLEGLAQGPSHTTPA